MLHAVLTEKAVHALQWPWDRAVWKMRHLVVSSFVASYHGGIVSMGKNEDMVMIIIGNIFFYFLDNVACG